MAQAALSVPVFKLYGETAWPTPDLLHCESIPTRSRLHDWQIKTHRHADLVQFLYVQAGRAQVSIEGQARQLGPGTLQVVPVMSIHGFRFSEDIQGCILSLAKPALDAMGAGVQGQPFDRPGAYAAGADRAHLDDLFARLLDEYAVPRAERELMLHALLGALLVWVARRAGEPPQRVASAQSRGQQHLAQFDRLIERHFKTHRPIDFYAQAIGVSTAHLNALCRQWAGQSALQRLNQRLTLEAKRNLVYTAMTVSEIADSLGFSEPAYFSRFFKRETGCTPKGFRLQRRGQR